MGLIERRWPHEIQQKYAAFIELVIVQFELDYTGPEAEWEMAIVDSPFREAFDLMRTYDVPIGEFRDLRISGYSSTGVERLYSDLLAKTLGNSVPRLVLLAHKGDTVEIVARTLDGSCWWGKQFEVSKNVTVSNGQLYARFSETLTVDY